MTVVGYNCSIWSLERFRKNEMNDLGEIQIWKQKGGGNRGHRSAGVTGV